MSMRPRLSFPLYASDRVLEDRSTLAHAWTSEIARRLGSDAHRSCADALDPAGIDVTLRHLAEYVADGDDDRFAQAEGVRRPMHELGVWSGRQGTEVHSLVLLFDRLAGLLDGACIEWTQAFPGEIDADEVVRVAGRLNRGPILMAAACVAGHESTRRAARGSDDYTELLAHELASPLNAAEVAAYLLENERVTVGSQELRRLAGQIQRNLRRVRALIGDVRDLSAAQDETASERLLPVGQVLGEVIAEMNPYARAAGVRIDVEEPIPGVRVPSARVALVLRNLISNAVKYADPQTEIRWVRISFVQAEGSDGWVVAVSDNGLGIPCDMHDRIFQRFVRLHPDRADGTGLGLAIAQETMLGMNGTLEFDSEPGVGSTFRFRLPG